MSDKYCIESGVYTSRAVWSDTDGGAGGATIPAAADNRRFNIPVSITKFVNPADYAGTTSIAAATEVTWELPNHACFYSEASLEVFGTLRTLGASACIFYGAGALRVHPGAVLEEFRAYVTQGCRLENRGVIRTKNNDTLILNTTDPSVRHVLGDIGHVTPRSVVGGTVVNLEDVAESVIDRLRFLVRINEGNLIVRLFTPARVRSLEFSLSEGSDGCRFEQYAPLKVSGDVTTLTGPLEWVAGEAATSTFFGTADQVIDMPAAADGQTWTADKAAGTLDLKRFEGHFQGRVRKLIVRPPSSIDLSGPPPYLWSEDDRRVAYDGIRADFSSQGRKPDLADRLRESLDSCSNYGLIVIPSGKTLLTKTFNNYTGARVSGEGTLLVRYGNLSNFGTIDGSVSVRFYDHPIAAALSAPAVVYSGGACTVDLTGSLGSSFRLDWGDGSFSESASAGRLEHVYVCDSGTTTRTLVLTATNEDGTVATATATVMLKTPKSPPTVGAIEIEERGRYHGIPRGNLPFPYRYTLAQGESFMPDTLQLFCPMNESGRALQNGSGLYLGRITHSDGGPVDPDEIESARYTVFRLDDSDASVRIPVEGHTDVSLDIDEILLPELMRDENWVFDSSGYNFRHIPNDSEHSPFPVAGRNYLVAYELRLKNAFPKIQIQYRVRVV